MATTLTAPISIPQINSYYYVGQPMLRTIQAAVSFAVADGNAGTVIIPQEYTGTDTVAAVTGGSTTVHIMDERGGQRQIYNWYNNAYIYEFINAQGGMLVPQLNNFAYVGFGVHQTIQEVVTNFATMPTLHIIIIVQPSYSGDEVIEELTGGDPGIVISDQRTAQWQNYSWNGITFEPADFEPLGAIIADTITANTIVSGDAEFDTCNVGESPVRTFANTADPQGPSYPPAGIGISTGTAWQVPSIDPATVPRLNTDNTFTGVNTTRSVIATGTIEPNAWNEGTTFIDFQASPSNAGRFMAKSTGTSLAMLSFAASTNDAAGRYLQYFNFSEPSGAGSAVGTFNTPINAMGGTTILGQPETQPTTSSWVQQGVSGVLPYIGINNSAAPADAKFWQEYVDDTGTLNYLLITDSTGGSAPWMTVQRTGVVPTTATLFPVLGAAGGQLRIGNRTNVSQWQTGSPNISTDGQSLILNANTNSSVIFNWDRVASVIFGNGSAAGVAMVDPLGNGSFHSLAYSNLIAIGTGDFNNIVGGGWYLITGTITNAPPSGDPRGFYLQVMGDNFQFGGVALQLAYNFNIPGETWKRQISFGVWSGWFLTNMTPATAGAEAMPIQFSGEAVTSEGLATITLPDTFESRTAAVGRTVHLTEIFEDEDEPDFGNFLAAGRIKDGKFTVRSSTPTVRFFWEVRAVRAEEATPLPIPKKKNGKIR